MDRAQRPSGHACRSFRLLDRDRCLGGHFDSSGQSGIRPMARGKSRFRMAKSRWGGGPGLPHLSDASRGSRGGIGAEHSVPTPIGLAFFLCLKSGESGGQFLAVSFGPAHGDDGHGSSHHLERAGFAGGSLCHILGGIRGGDRSKRGNFTRWFCRHPAVESDGGVGLLGDGGGKAARPGIQPH